jgi:hypothetical protein
MHHTHFFAIADEAFGGSVERHVETVEVFDSLNRLGGNADGIDVAMRVDNFLHFAVFLLFTTIDKRCPTAGKGCNFERFEQ